MNNKTNKIAQLRQRQRLLQILIFSLITITIWVTFSLFRSQKKTVISADQKRLAEPLNPNIRVEVLQSLQQKKIFSESEISAFPIYKILFSKDGRQNQVVTIDTKEADLTELKASPAPSPTPSAAALPSPNPSPLPSEPITAGN